MVFFYINQILCTITQAGDFEIPLLKCIGKYIILLVAGSQQWRSTQVAEGSGFEHQ